jgi:hypothetical protein
MNRVEAELDLLRHWFADSLDYEPGEQWVRLRAYRVPSALWKASILEVAFQIPPDVAVNPYGFCVRPAAGVADASDRLSPARGTGDISNYTFPASTPWGDNWGRFSWQLVEWQPRDPITTGSTVLDFARSIAARFQEGP